MEQENRVEMLYETYGGRLCSRAKYILNDEEQGKKALEDTFFKVIRYEYLFDWEDEEETLRLLATFLRCACFNRMRRLRKIKYSKKIHLPGEVSSNSEPTHGLIAQLLKKENLRWFKDTFSSLGSPFKEICILKFYYNVKTSAAAKITGLTAAEANALLCKKLFKLKTETDHRLGGNISTAEMGVVMGAVCKKFADEEVKKINSDTIKLSPLPEKTGGKIRKALWLKKFLPLIIACGSALIILAVILAILL